MAFGNGAPDVFSSIAAIKYMKDGDTGVAMGALLGKVFFIPLEIIWNFKIS